MREDEKVDGCAGAVSLASWSAWLQRAAMLGLLLAAMLVVAQAAAIIDVSPKGLWGGLLLLLNAGIAIALVLAYVKDRADARELAALLFFIASGIAAYLLDELYGDVFPFQQVTPAWFAINSAVLILATRSPFAAVLWAIGAAVLVLQDHSSILAALEPLGLPTGKGIAAAILAFVMMFQIWAALLLAAGALCRFSAARSDQATALVWMGNAAGFVAAHLSLLLTAPDSSYPHSLPYFALLLTAVPLVALVANDVLRRRLGTPTLWFGCAGALGWLAPFIVPAVSGAHTALFALYWAATGWAIFLWGEKRSDVPASIRHSTRGSPRTFETLLLSFLLLTALGTGATVVVRDELTRMKGIVLRVGVLPYDLPAYAGNTNTFSFRFEIDWRWVGPPTELGDSQLCVLAPDTKDGEIRVRRIEYGAADATGDCHHVIGGRAGVTREKRKTFYIDYRLQKIDVAGGSAAEITKVLRQANHRVTVNFLLLESGVVVVDDWHIDGISPVAFARAARAKTR